MPRELVTDNLTVMLVVFDDKDADGIRLALLGVGHQIRKREDVPNAFCFWPGLKLPPILC